jgi:hypothetical protein
LNTPGARELLANLADYATLLAGRLVSLLTRFGHARTPTSSAIHRTSLSRSLHRTPPVLEP